MAFDSIAPRYIVDIGGTELDEEITQFITSVEYESVDGMADQARLTVQNPNLDLQDLKIFQAGNEMSIWLGYGQTLKHIGRTIIRKTNWAFPESDIPGITVTGMTLDAKMMDNEPEEGTKRRYKNETFSGIVKAVADRYSDAGLKTDIDDTDDEARDRVQPAGVSDYRVIKSCANLAGYFFWIDGDENCVWTLHFKSPSKVLD